MAQQWWEDKLEETVESIETFMAPPSVELETLEFPRSAGISSTHYLVNVTLDGVSGKFLVDASLPYSVMTPQMAARSEEFQTLTELAPDELLERLEKLRRDLNELEGGPADLPRLTLREDLRKVSNIYVNNTFDLKGERLMVVHDFYMAKEAEKLGVTISGIMGMDMIKDLTCKLILDKTKPSLRLELPKLKPEPGLTLIRGLTLPLNTIGLKISFTAPETGWVPDASSLEFSESPAPKVNTTFGTIAKRPPEKDSADLWIRELYGVAMFEQQRDDAASPILAPAAPLLRAPLHTPSEAATAGQASDEKLHQAVENLEDFLDNVDAKPSPPKEKVEEPKMNAPVLGVLATGSPFTVINWQAAEMLDIFKNTPELRECPGIDVMSPGGVWTRLPLVQLNVQLWDFTEFGEYGLENNSQMKESLQRFQYTSQDPSINFTKPILVAIGDLSVDAYFKANGVAKGPVALIGQDVLMQQSYSLSVTPSSSPLIPNTLAFKTSDAEEQSNQKSSLWDRFVKAFNFRG
jgi:hypothetical protein